MTWRADPRISGEVSWVIGYCEPREAEREKEEILKIGKM